MISARSNRGRFPSRWIPCRSRWTAAGPDAVGIAGLKNRDSEPVARAAQRDYDGSERESAPLPCHPEPSRFHGTDRPRRNGWTGCSSKDPKAGFDVGHPHPTRLAAGSSGFLRKRVPQEAGRRGSQRRSHAWSQQWQSHIWSREWSQRWDSNPQPPDYKSGALPLSHAGLRGSRRRKSGRSERSLRIE